MEKYARHKFIYFKDKEVAERFSTLYDCGEVFESGKDKYLYCVLIRNSKEEMAKIVKAIGLKKIKREDRQLRGYSYYIYE